mmetsp:Transcript_24767/g.62774  ORF Transcript_24767/g.62774 Transcript_24767/m.62774 type:complete len:241 (-) Transcript_24767:69-791(-)
MLPSVGIPMPVRYSKVLLPHSALAMGSFSPCPMKMGIFLLTGSGLSAMPRGNQVLSPMAPPRGTLACMAAARAMLPPWLKPAMTMRSEGVPDAISSSTILRTWSTERWMPSESLRSSEGDRPSMSNHAGIDMPSQTDTSRVGAVGQRNLTWGTEMVSRILVQPLPVSPRPWRKMTVPVASSGASATCVLPKAASMRRESAGLARIALPATNGETASEGEMEAWRAERSEGMEGEGENAEA